MYWDTKVHGQGVKKDQGNSKHQLQNQGAKAPSFATKQQHAPHSMEVVSLAFAFFSCFSIWFHDFSKNKTTVW